MSPRAFAIMALAAMVTIMWMFALLLMGVVP